MGWARIISSVSIAIRLRYFEAGGSGSGDLTEQEWSELDRQRACREHAALDRSQQLGNCQ
jgi:hypothetical protein